MPGTPAVVAGSNRYLAWALTASVILNTTDPVRLETDPANPRRYRTPSGWQEFQQFAETIHVRGGKSVDLAVEETIWGPVVTRGKTQFALACTLHEAQAINLRSIEMERARDTETALGVSGLAGTPVLNFIVGDRAGRHRLLCSGSSAESRWFRWEHAFIMGGRDTGLARLGAAADYPRFVNPSNGICGLQTTAPWAVRPTAACTSPPRTMARAPARSR